MPLLAVTYFQEHDLDLNRYLQPHPLSTYFLRMEGNALSGAGICNGDILVVDRSRNAAPGCLIIAEPSTVNYGPAPAVQRGNIPCSAPTTRNRRPARCGKMTALLLGVSLPSVIRKLL